MNSSLELEIEKMIYGGDGLARLPADDRNRRKTAFLPFVLDGEKVSARVTEDKPAFLRAWPEQILSESSHRVAPGCVYFQKCGGCHYQHSDYQYQLHIKQSILRETLLRTGKIDWPNPVYIHSAEPWNYRNRTRMKVQSPEGGKFALGYFRFASHQLLPVDDCPISSPLINRAIKSMWELGINGNVPAEIKEIEFFANEDDTRLLIELWVLSSDNSLQQFAQRLASSLPQMRGASAFVISPEQPISASKSVWQFAESSLLYRTKSDSYRVRAGSFFQTNRFLTDTLIDLALADVKGQHAVDLYAGVGLFSLPLARRFKRVTAVESAPASFADLRSNVPENVAAVRSSTAEFLQQKKIAPEFVIVDPPRAGLGTAVAKSIVKIGASRIAYVSCDPTTLARDLAVLIAAGYRIRSVDLVDLFPQTFHFETIVHLLR